MIKVSPLVYISLALSLTFFLISPYRLVQFICLGILFVFLISFLYALVLSRSIKAERNTEKLKLACKEHSQISFTIKNYSPLTAHILYFFDDIPFFQVFDDGNKDLTRLRPHEIQKIHYEVTSRDRGLFHAGPVRFRTSDPLGLFIIDMQVDCPLEITVRPARIKLITEAVPGFLQGCIKINNPC